MMHVGDIMSTMGVFSIVGDINEYHGGVHYRGGISSCMWRDITMHVEGHLEYRGGCSVLWDELKKISRFEGFDSQKYRCSFLSITFFPVLS